MIYPPFGVSRNFPGKEGGSRFAGPDEVVDESGDMGYFPVGSECAKSLPKAWRFLFETEEAK